MNDFHDITSGWETEIFSFNLTWKGERREEKEALIVRVFAPGVGAKAERESRVMRLLLEMGYPVPRIHVTESDKSILGKPFIIMGRIDGGTLEDRISVPDTDHPKWKKVFSRLFVDLHNLDWTPFVPDSIIIPKDDPYFIIDRTLVSYSDHLERYGKIELNPILEWLKSNVDKVPCKRPSVTHGDFHPMNILIDESQTPYVIDWGASGVRDFRMDLAWTLLLTRAYSTKENRDSILNAYQQAAGREIEELEYFEVLAILRRLSDVLISMSEGSNAMGMREGA
ncbi:MAG: phosphotransferase family protein, partial [Candidatus Thorarchaeota archaeon]